MWIGPACRKPDVTSRHQSPLSTAGPKSRRSFHSWPDPPLNPFVARKTTAQRMMSATVTRGSPRVDCIVCTFVRWRAHSGQRMPTGVGVMQSGQMGLPHEEQDTPVSRDGCR
jgi:hypothetical protein